MNIAINAHILSEADAGVANYTKNLIESLLAIDSQNSYTLFGRKEYLERFSKGKVSLSCSDLSLKKSPVRLLWEHFILPLKLRRNDLDIFHFPDHSLSLLGLPCPGIITIHDLAFWRIPKAFNYTRQIYKRFVSKRSIRKAERIIAVSDFTGSELKQIFNIPDGKISVVHNGVSKSFSPHLKSSRIQEIKKKYAIDENFILFVGTIEPRKNLPRLVRAYDKLLKGSNIGQKLVIIGAKGWLYKETFKTVQELGLNRRVIFLGYIPEYKLPYFYNLADLFVYPSLYEGFGLPPLEAMACGTAVISSNTSSLPEVVGDAAILVDPYNVDEIAEVMYSVLSNEGLRKKLEEKGLKRAKMFPWEKTAQKTLQVYEEVYKN